MSYQFLEEGYISDLWTNHQLSTCSHYTLDKWFLMADYVWQFKHDYVGNIIGSRILEMDFKEFKFEIDNAAGYILKEFERSEDVSISKIAIYS